MTTVRAILPTEREEPPHDGVILSEFSVGRFRVRMVNHVDMMVRGSVSQMNVEWVPHFPSKLTKKELRQYIEHRNRHNQRLANITGGSILVVDV